MSDEQENFHDKSHEHISVKIEDLVQALQLKSDVYSDDVSGLFQWDDALSREFNKERYAVVSTYSNAIPRFNRYITKTEYPIFFPRNITKPSGQVYLSSSEFPDNAYSETLNMYSNSLNIELKGSRKLLTPGFSFQNFQFRNNLTVIDPQYNYLYQAFDDSIFVYLLNEDSRFNFNEPILELSIQDDDVTLSDFYNANWPQLPNGINQLKVERFLKFTLLIAPSDNSHIYFFDTKFIHDEIQKRINDKNLQRKLRNEFTFKLRLERSVWGVEVLGEFGIIIVSSNDKKITSFQLYVDDNMFVFEQRDFSECEANVPELKIINKHKMKYIEIESLSSDISSTIPTSSVQLLSGNIKGKVLKFEYVFILRSLPILNTSNIKEILGNALIDDKTDNHQEIKFKIKNVVEGKNQMRCSSPYLDFSKNQFDDYDYNDDKYEIGFNIMNVTKFKLPIWGFHELSKNDFIKIDTDHESAIINGKFFENVKKIEDSLNWVDKSLFEEEDEGFIEKLVTISDYPSVNLIPIQNLSVSIITMLTYICKLKAIEINKISQFKPYFHENYIITTMDRGCALMNSELIVNSFGFSMGYMLFIFSKSIPELSCHIRIDVSGVIHVTRFYILRNKFVHSKVYKIMNLYEEIAEIADENALFEPGYILGFDIQKIENINGAMKFRLYVVDNRQNCHTIEFSEDMFTDTYLDFDF